jgi:hypothetical protein
MLTGLRKIDMATDIRRMSKNELDDLNRPGREYREQQHKPAQDQTPSKSCPLSLHQNNSVTLLKTKPK